MTENRNNIDRTRTIIQENENQEQEQNQEQYKYNDNYYYNNNTITTRTQACSKELPGDEIMEKIAEAYKANVGPVITQAAASVIENALKAGMEPSTVIWAIEETGLAARPSPYYLRAVLRNWAEWGVATSRAREDWKRTNGMPWWKR